MTTKRRDFWNDPTNLANHLGCYEAYLKTADAEIVKCESFLAEAKRKREEIFNTLQQISLDTTGRPWIPHT